MKHKHLEAGLRGADCSILEAAVSFPGGLPHHSYFTVAGRGFISTSPLTPLPFPPLLLLMPFPEDTTFLFNLGGCLTIIQQTELLQEKSLLSLQPKKHYLVHRVAGDGLLPLGIAGCCLPQAHPLVILPLGFGKALYFMLQFI